MSTRRRRYKRQRLLRITFVLSLLALIVSFAALFLTATRRSDLTRRYLAQRETNSVIVQDNLPSPVQETPQTGTVFREIFSGSDTNNPQEQAAGLPKELEKTREAAGLSDEVIAAIRADSAELYYYRQLSEEEAVLYAELYHIMSTHAKNVFVSVRDAKVLEKVHSCVLCDHPEIFYISGYYTTRYTLDGETVGFSFTGRYLYDAEECARRNERIEAYVERCLSGAPAGDDYVKVRYIYEYLIANTSYEAGAADNQNICSVMMNGVSVCQGYAKSAQLLLNRLGIPATLVIGTVRTQAGLGPHAWNLVLSGGQWYYLDVTWGDASFQEGESVSEGTNYDYLLTTTEDISHTHTIGTVVDMPLCQAMADNYYVRENAYFTEASLEAFGELVQRRNAEGAVSVTFKCRTAEVYEAMMTELVDHSRIFDYIFKPPGESLVFTRSPEHKSFTVWF